MAKIDDPNVQIQTIEVGKATVDTGVFLASVVFPALSIPIGVTWLGGKVFLSLYKEKLQKRSQEFNEHLDIETISMTLKNEPKSREILGSLFQKVWEEVSEKKRALYYNYINNVANKKGYKHDNTSKTLTIMSLIDFKEIEFLSLFKSNYAESLELSLMDDKNNILSRMPNSKKNEPRRLKVVNENYNRGVTVNYLLKVDSIKERYDETSIEEILQMLTSYGLIRELPGRMNGTFYGPLTSFGSDFIDSISSPT